MAQMIRDVMTRNPATVDATAPLVEAAQLMQTEDIGDVLVTEGGRLVGVLTDRDIVIRGVAEGREISTRVAELCSRDVVALPADSSVHDAIELMREHAVRRLPITEDERPVGIVSLGDLAIEADPESVLGQISAATPTE